MFKYVLTFRIFPYEIFHKIMEAHLRYFYYCEIKIAKKFHFRGIKFRGWQKFDFYEIKLCLAIFSKI